MHSEDEKNKGPFEVKDTQGNVVDPFRVPEAVTPEHGWRQQNFIRTHQKTKAKTNKNISLVSADHRVSSGLFLNDHGEYVSPSIPVEFHMESIFVALQYPKKLAAKKSVHNCVVRIVLTEKTYAELPLIATKPGLLTLSEILSPKICLDSGQFFRISVEGFPFACMVETEILVRGHAVRPIQ